MECDGMEVWGLFRFLFPRAIAKRGKIGLGFGAVMAGNCFCRSSYRIIVRGISLYSNVTPVAKVTVSSHTNS